MNKYILPIVMILGVVSIIGVVYAGNWATEFAIPIYKGWNLVYGFASPDQLEGQGFEKSHIKAIYAFNPASQEYVRMYPNREDSKINIDDDILLQTAFWVYSDKTVEGSFNNKPSYTEYWLYTNPLPYNERPLYQGWNFFGLTPDIVGKNMNDIKGDCNIEKMYGWNNHEISGGGDWDSINVDYTFTQNIIGRGIIIKVTENCKLGTSTEVGTSPPGLPSNDVKKSPTELTDINRNKISLFVYDYYVATCNNWERGYYNNDDCKNAWKCMSIEYARLLPEADIIDLTNYMNENGGEKGLVYYSKKNPSFGGTTKIPVSECFKGRYTRYKEGEFSI